jgi:hypothetical protein
MEIGLFLFDYKFQIFHLYIIRSVIYNLNDEIDSLILFQMEKIIFLF